MNTSNDLISTIKRKITAWERELEVEQDVLEKARYNETLSRERFERNKTEIQIAKQKIKMLRNRVLVAKAQLQLKQLPQKYRNATAGDAIEQMPHSLY